MTEEFKTTITIYNEDGKPIEADIDQLECALKNGYTKTPPESKLEAAPARPARRTRATS